ncbi:MAG: hypothetical protein ABW001_14760 [Mycobacterium sp.]
MSGRHRRLTAAPEPTPDGLSVAVAAALDAAQSAIDDSAGFEESVLALFTDAVWRLHDDHRMMVWRADLDAMLPALVAASTAALPGVVCDIATRLEVLAAASDVDLLDPESLAELLGRTAHALLLVPDVSIGGRNELGDYAHRHVAPVVRSAIVGEAHRASRPAPARRRRARGELLAATMIALVIASAGWVTIESQSAPPSVAPTNLTGTIPAPQQRGSEAPASPLPSSSSPEVPQAPAAPMREAAGPSGRTPAQPASLPARVPVIAERGDSSGSKGPDRLPLRVGPLVGPRPPGAPPSGATPPAFTFGGGFVRPQGVPPSQASNSQGAGVAKPKPLADAAHSGTHSVAHANGRG